MRGLPIFRSSPLDKADWLIAPLVLFWAKEESGHIPTRPSPFP